MGKVQKRWAKMARVRLIVRLGGVCALCGAEERLEFDCKTPCGDKHHRMDTSARMSFYHKQHFAGNLQILCEKCNNKKSVAEHPNFDNDPDQRPQQNERESGEFGPDWRV